MVQIRKVLGSLGLAMKAGDVVSGEFMTEKAIREGIARLVIVAKDASGNTLEAWNNVAASSFPYSISVTGIEDSTAGTLVITWLDSDGNAIGSAQTESVTFEAQ